MWMMMMGPARWRWVLCRCLDLVLGGRAERGGRGGCRRGERVEEGVVAVAPSLLLLVEVVWMCLCFGWVASRVGLVV